MTSKSILDTLEESSEIQTNKKLYKTLLEESQRPLNHPVNYYEPLKTIAENAAVQTASLEEQVKTLKGMLLEMQDSIVLAKEKAESAKQEAIVATRRFRISIGISVIALIISVLSLLLK